MARASELQRSADFWIGVPLVWLLGAARGRRRLPALPRRVGVVSPSAIGDLILSSGVYIHLKERYPSVEIHLFNGASNAGAVPLLPVDVISHKCDFAQFRATLSEIRSSQVDLLIDLTPWPRLTAIYAALCGAPTVGFQSERQYRHYAFDVPVAHSRDRHEVENLAAVTAVFAPSSPYAVRVRQPSPEITCPGVTGHVILCHVAPGGSRARAKSWPAPYWVRLVRWLVGNGFAVGFTGVETDQGLVTDILSNLSLPPGAAFSLCGKLSLEQLAAAFVACRMCITVDTGIVHLASALGVPTVGLFGATHSRRWGATSACAINLDSAHKEAGFIHLGFERSPYEMEVMQDISVARVREAVQCLLIQTERRSALGQG
jgi:ADP-heptose:LPS heptosyltransferase